MRHPLDANPSSRDELLLIATIGDRKFAFPAESIERVVQMAYFTPVQGADERVVGALNVRGASVAVVDPRPFLHASTLAPAIDHHLILMSCEPRFAIWVDHVERIMTADPDDVLPLGGDARASSMLRLDSELIPIVPIHELVPSQAGVTS
jgi:chemotaxis signal transduction protein